MIHFTQHPSNFFVPVDFHGCLKEEKKSLYPSYAQRRDVASSYGMNHSDRYEGGRCTHSLA